MPIYEYLCSKGHQYERAEGFDAPSQQTCPRCGSQSRRRISLPAVIFKGQGFYSTDNRRQGVGGNGAGSSIGSDGEKTAKRGGESKAEATKAD